MIIRKAFIIGHPLLLVWLLIVSSGALALPVWQVDERGQSTTLYIDEIGDITLPGTIYLTCYKDETFYLLYSPGTPMGDAVVVPVTYKVGRMREHKGSWTRSGRYLKPRHSDRLFRQMRLTRRLEINGDVFVLDGLSGLLRKYKTRCW